MYDLLSSVLPGQSRGFIHKRIGGAIGGFVSSGFNPLGAVGGFIGGGGSAGSSVPQGSLTRSRGGFQQFGGQTITRTGLAQSLGVSRVSNSAWAAFQRTGQLPATGGPGQPFPTSAAACVPGINCPGDVVNRPGFRGAVERFLPGGSTGLVTVPQGPGTAMQLHSAELHGVQQPQVETVQVRRCFRGSVLGIDGLCHPRKQIRNSDREWPKPPRPLGTRSELKAVRVAGTFANRLKRNEKSLRKTARVLAGATRGR